MANFLSNDDSIQGKWGPPPKLDAAPIGAVLAALLHDKQVQQEQTRRAISDTIKNIQQQRASGAYLDAARQAGVLPEGALEGVDSPYAGVMGGKLADQIREQADSTSRRSYEDAIRQRILDKTAAGDPGSLGGHEPGDSWQDANGRWWYQTKTGPHMLAMSGQDTNLRPVSEKDTYQIERDKQKAVDDLQLWRKIEEQQNTALGAQTKDPKYQNVPFSRQSEEDQLRRDIEDIRRRRTQPQTSGDQSSGQGQTTMPEQRFGSEQDARAAGHQAGEKVLIFDPATKQYRTAVLD
jgi:hypothetical protein